MDDRYSVVVPAFNSAAFVGAAIDSLLRQSLRPHRIIVVDDGSTDETAKAVRGFGERAHLVSQDNTGPGAATTNGMALVDTPFTAFLDADDLWMENKASSQLSRLQADASLDGLFTQGALSRTGQPPFSGLPTQPIWGRSSLMIRTGRARSVGRIVDQPGQRGDMIDWIARARDIGLRLEMMDAVLVVRRVHEGSLTYHRGAKDTGYLAVVKAALDRRRAGAS